MQNKHFYDPNMDYTYCSFCHEILVPIDVGNHGNDRRTRARSVAAILDLTSSCPFLHRN